MDEQLLLISWRRYQRNAERKHLPAVYKAIKAQYEAWSSTGDISKINSDDLRRVIGILRRDSAVVWGHKIYVQINRLKNRRPMGFSERIYQLMAEYFGIDLLNDSEEITETTRETIRQALSRGALLGNSFDEIVRDMNIPELSRNRARTIARTETVGAANKASLVVAKDSGLSLDKKWMSVKDNRTRHDHILADGQTVPVDQFYNVGGSEMAHPGDRGGKNGKPKVLAKEIVRCRCTQAFIPKRDGNGRLISAI